MLCALPGTARTILRDPADVAPSATPYTCTLERGQPGVRSNADAPGEELPARPLARATVQMSDHGRYDDNDFESALAELETIVTKLEQGDLPLEQSLALFERGVQLSRFCHARLEDAERRIEMLTERGEVQAGAGIAR